MNQRNKVIAVTLVLTTAFSQPALTVAAANEQAQQTAADWAVLPIRIANQLGVLTGDAEGGLRPEDNITRVEMCVLLTRLLKLEPSVQPVSSYRDVPADHWGAAYINAVTRAGLMSGDTNGRFRPHDPITREEMAVTLVRAAQIDPTGKGAQLRVADAEQVSPWARDAVAAVIELGLMKGDGRNFHPQAPAQRQEAAVVAVNLHDLQPHQATITRIANGMVVLDGVSYQVPESLAGLFRVQNNVALQGAKVRFESSHGAVAKVTSLELTAGGSSAQVRAMLDAGGSEIAGDLRVAADHVVLQNVRVAGDVTIAPAVQQAFAAHHVTVQGKATVTTTAPARIEFHESRLAELDVDMQGGRIEAKGKTTVGTMAVYASTSVAADVPSLIELLLVKDGRSTFELHGAVKKIEAQGTSTAGYYGRGTIDVMQVHAGAKATLYVNGTIGSLLTPPGVNVRDVITTHDLILGHIGLLNGQKPVVPTPVQTQPGSGTGSGNGNGGTLPGMNDNQSVLAAAAGLTEALVLNGNQSAAQVVSGLQMPTAGQFGTAIAWSSDNTAVIDTNGTVTRPAAGAGDASVTLVATITKGTATVTKTFNFQVIRQGGLQNEQDLTAAELDKQLLAIGYQPGDAETSVTGDLTLPTSGVNGSTISWTANPSALIAPNGTVTRPYYTGADTQVTLTAQVVKGTAVVQRTFTVTVLKWQPTQAELDADAVTADKQALSIGYQNPDHANSVTSNVTLPTTGANGSTIVWASSDGAVAADGTVTRPAYNAAADVTVTLTATITKGTAVETRTFPVIVRRALPTQGQLDADAVAADQAALNVQYAGGDSAGSVTQNVTLASAGANGSTITWTTSDAGAVATNGTVTRPHYSAATDSTVTLTATITKGASSTTKTFTVTVLRRVATQAELDADAVAADHAALAVGYQAGDSAASVTGNVTLAPAGANGTTITWTTSNAGAVATNGTVTRPHYSAATDSTVTLTATIAKGASTTTKTFTVTVLRRVATQAELDADAVAADHAALAVGYQAGDSATSVTSNVTLTPAGANGTTITWTTSDAGAIATNGTVTRPHYSAATDSTVTLTATLTKGASSTTKTFTVTVLRRVATPAELDADAVAADHAALAVGYQAGDSATSVTGNVTLAPSGANGTTITWTTSDAGAIATNGTVTRPHYSAATDSTVTLTATITKGASSTTKTFTVTVLRRMATQAELDADAVAADHAALVVGYLAGDSASSVTGNVTLAPTGANGTTITWTTSDAGTVATNGTVTRPHYGAASDTTVTLTATITKGASSTTKTFTVTVLRRVATQAELDADAVAADHAALAVGYQAGDSASSVTGNVTLAPTGANGTTITWTTSDAGAVATNGTVTRPHYSAATDSTVTLTATITKGASSTTKTFTVTVLRRVATQAELDADAVAADHAALAVGYQAGDSAASVTGNLTFASTGANGSTITWTTSNGATVANNGVVTRPHYSAATDSTVTLTATITKGASTTTKTFTVTVLRRVATQAELDADAVAADHGNLGVTLSSGDSASSVKGNVTLVTSGANGTNISWTSSQPGVISATGVVTRPAGATGNQTVTLTATVTKGGASQSKSFLLTVLTVPYASLSTTTLNEAAANDGTVAGSLTITLTNGTYTAGLTKADTSLLNLPTGLNYTITRLNDTQLQLAFTGQATQHEIAHNVSNLQLVINQAAINGATSSTTTPSFGIAYLDPVVGIPTITGLTTAESDYRAFRTVQNTLTWTSAQNATSYEVFRNTTNSMTGATKLATLGAGTLTYTDMTMEDARISYYFVVATDGVRRSVQASGAQITTAQDIALQVNEAFGSGGANVGGVPAPYKWDFIELYNPSNAPVNLAGWTLQFDYGTYTGSFRNAVNLVNSIPAKGYYLIRLGNSGGTSGAELPVEDVNYNLDLSGETAKIALVNSTTRITTSNDAGVVDFLGYGNAAGKVVNDFEGNTGSNTPLPGMTVNTSVHRRTPGVDTNSNLADFTRDSAVTPKNTQTP